MYVRLNALQPRTEEWIKKSWKAGKWSPNAVINAEGKLIDDMRPLTFQIQVCSNTIKKLLARVAGATDVPAWADDETTFEQLHARIAKTQDLIKSIDESKYVDAETEVELQVGPHTMKISAKKYMLGYALPNFFFHLNTTYAILRSKGVPIGKADYIGPFMA